MWSREHVKLAATTRLAREHTWSADEVTEEESLRMISNTLESFFENEPFALPK